MRSLLLTCFAFFCFSSKAQFLQSSNTNIESCNELDTCVNINNISYLYYDETKSEFFLKVDFSNFRTKETADNWINKERDTLMFLRMIFPRDKFPVLAAEERKSYQVNARIFYVNKWKDIPVEIIMFNANNNLLDNTSTNTNYTNDGVENYKISFVVPLIPSEFKRYPQIYYTTQTVKINVTLGRINTLKPGMEHLLSEVYYLPNR